MPKIKGEKHKSILSRKRMAGENKGKKEKNERKERKEWQGKIKEQFVK